MHILSRPVNLLTDKHHTMKKIFIPLFLMLILSIFSCQEEELTISEETEIEEPVQVDYPVYEGQVVENGTPVAQLPVAFYQNGELVDSVFTDENGFFSTVEYELVSGSEVTFSFVHEGYVPKYRRYLPNEALLYNINQEIHAVNSENRYALRSELEDPGDPELIKIYGSYTDIHGMPIQGAVTVVAYNIRQIDENTFKYDGAWDVSDENGYVEFLLEPGHELFAYAQTKDLPVQCNQVLIVGDMFSWEPGTLFRNLGVQDSDLELEEDKVALDPYNLKVNGRLLDCQSNPVSDGRIELKLSTMQNSQLTWEESYETTSLSQDGSFEINIENCFYGNRKIEIKATTNDNYSVEYEARFSDSRSELDIENLLACDETGQDGSYLGYLYNIQIGDLFEKDSIPMSVTPAPDGRLNFTGVFSISGNLVWIRGQMSDVLSGRQDIYLFSLNATGQDYPWEFYAETGDIQISWQGQIDQIYRGELEGTVSTVEEGDQSFTASIELGAR